MHKKFDSKNYFSNSLYDPYFVLNTTILLTIDIPAKEFYEKIFNLTTQLLKDKKLNISAQDYSSQMLQLLNRACPNFKSDNFETINLDELPDFLMQGKLNNLIKEYANHIPFLPNEVQDKVNWETVFLKKDIDIINAIKINTGQVFLKRNSQYSTILYLIPVLHYDKDSKIFNRCKITPQNILKLIPFNHSTSLCIK